MKFRSITGLAAILAVTVNTVAAEVKKADLYDAIKESCATSETFEDTSRWVGLNR